jgi:hypothetical protein
VVGGTAAGYMLATGILAPVAIGIAVVGYKTKTC